MSTSHELTEIQAGSKSFYLASLFLDAEARTRSHLLYRWCRYVDDQIDETPDRRAQEARLRHLVDETLRLFESDARATEPAFEALQVLVRECRIPSQYPLDLLQGMKRDIENPLIASEHELVWYSYCVASTVGLMMCHVAGVRDDSALEEAFALGVAMQLTNIARDVKADASMGRRYLPESFFPDGFDVSPKALLGQLDQPEVFDAVVRLLDLADRYYVRAESGISKLSRRTALAIWIARFVYAEIGREIRRRGPKALEGRTVVSRFHKFVCVLRAFYRWLPGAWQSRTTRAPQKVYLFQ